MSGKIFTSVIPLLALIPFSSSAGSWVDVSNAYTNKQIKITSQFQPEMASSIGITEADNLCSSITKAQQDKYIQTLNSSKKTLLKALETETLLPVRQDLNIIIDDIDQRSPHCLMISKKKLPG